MKWLRENLLGLLLIAGAFAIWAVLYPRMPDVVPTHWNWRGIADGHQRRLWGSLLMPVITAAMFLLFRALPALSPRGFSMAPFHRVYQVCTTVMIGFFVYFGALVNLAQARLGPPIGRGTQVGVGVGLLFVVLGNYFGKLTRNFFFGIRTPWTLASDEVWLRTHRFGGKVFVAGGAALILGALVGTATVPLVLGVVAGVALVPAAYSYIVYRRIEGFHGPP